MKLGLDFGGEIFHLLHGDRAFITGFHDAGEQLRFVENLAGIVLFYDDERQTFDHLIGGETILTGQTFSSAAYAGTLFCRAGIDHLAFGVSADGTFQNKQPPRTEFDILSIIISHRF